MKATIKVQSPIYGYYICPSPIKLYIESLTGIASLKMPESLSLSDPATVGDTREGHKNQHNQEQILQEIINLNPNIEITFIPK